MQGDIRQAAAPRLPDGPIEIVVPAEPSGGWDVTAQAIQSVLRQKQIVKGDVHIVYKSGGGGEKGWKYVNKSSKQTISMTSSLILSNDLLGQSKKNTKNQIIYLRLVFPYDGKKARQKGE